MNNRSVLIIDDEFQLRSMIKKILSLEGYSVREADNIKTAENIIKKEPADIILCDVRLPDGNGVEFTKHIKSELPDSEIILLTAYGNISDGIQAMKNGAFDYLIKGNENDKIIPVMAKAMEKVNMKKRIGQLEKQIEKKYSFDKILGNSAAIQNAVTLAKKVALTDTNVLILGETGTGKEIFAQAIHFEGKRARGPFLALNCSAFARDLLENEIFGHKAGAFTGATKDKRGLIEEANTGTIFLDEIADMHIELQSKLLRVLETSEFIKLGDTRPTKVNVRIIAATNRDLNKEIEKGKFREDLFYRLNVFTITLPPLRERKEDIPSISNYFLKIYSEKTNKSITSISTEAIKKLEQHPWNGNVRELKNVIERAVILSDGAVLQPDAFPLEFQKKDNESGNSSLELSSVEKKHIQHVLTHVNGNKAEAARLLNIGLTTLYRKIDEYGIK